MKKITPILTVAIVILSFQNTIAQIYSNGSISTGTTSLSNVTSPAGYTWSEIQNNTGTTNQANGIAGFPGYYFNDLTTSYRIADDFVVPDGQTWDVSSFDFFIYQSGYFLGTPPIDNFKIQIYNVNPSTPGATPIFGNMTTNVYDAINSSNAFMYRIYNSMYPNQTQAPGTLRRIFKVRANLAATLPPGTYWIEFQTHATDNSYVFFPTTTVVGNRSVAGANARLNVVASTTAGDVLGWQALNDIGIPATAPDVAQEIPFLVNGNVLGNNQFEKSDLFSLYPNPVKENLTIFSEDKSFSKIEIFDLHSRIIKKIISDNNLLEINVNDLKAGIYLIKIYTDEGEISKKFIKQ